MEGPSLLARMGVVPTSGPGKRGAGRSVVRQNSASPYVRPGLFYSIRPLHLNDTLFLIPHSITFTFSIYPYSQLFTYPTPNLRPFLSMKHPNAVTPAKALR